MTNVKVNPSMQLAKSLKMKREKLGWSIKEAIRKTGCSNIGKIERGLSIPTRKSLDKLKKAYGLTVVMKNNKGETITATLDRPTQYQSDTKEIEKLTTEIRECKLLNNQLTRTVEQYKTLVSNSEHKLSELNQHVEDLTKHKISIEKHNKFLQDLVLKFELNDPKSFENYEFQHGDSYKFNTFIFNALDIFMPDKNLVTTKQVNDYIIVLKFYMTQLEHFFDNDIRGILNFNFT